MILDYALTFAIACFGLGLLLNLWRLATRPIRRPRAGAGYHGGERDRADRPLRHFASATGFYFEAAMLFAMTGFVSTVAYAKYILRGDIIE
jgi:multicomponent K+:H+ antiporter subunit F